MLAREVGTNDLRAYIGGRKIHVHALPAVLPFRVGEEASQHFGVEVTFAFEIAVETAVGETGAGHDLLNRNILETVAIEKLSRALNDVFSHFCAVAGGIGHRLSSVIRGGSMARTTSACLAKHYFEHILIPCWYAGTAVQPRGMVSKEKRMSEGNPCALVAAPTRRKLITGMAMALGSLVVQPGVWGS